MKWLDDANNSEESIWAEAMSQTEKEHRAYFDKVDKDGSGIITWAELTENLQKSRRSHEHDESLRLFACDKDHDDNVSWEEYIKFMRDIGLVKEEETVDNNAEEETVDNNAREFREECIRDDVVMMW